MRETPEFFNFTTDVFDRWAALLITTTAQPCGSIRGEVVSVVSAGSGDERVGDSMIFSSEILSVRPGKWQ